jgi:hypothetical protein
VPLAGGEGFPAFRTPGSVMWCGLSQPSAGQLDLLPAALHPTLEGCCRQSRHSCFAWTRSSLSFGVMSRNVGQSFGACSLVQPNTGHCRDFLTGGAWPPSAACEPPSASKAALAALLAALFFFFPPWVIAAALADGVLPDGCAAGVPDDEWAVVPRSSGDAGRIFFKNLFRKIKAVIPPVR